MSKFKLFIVIPVILLLASIIGCGQTGDLYLPEDPAEDNSKQKSKDQSKN